MRDEQHRRLTLFARPPARLTVEQTAWVLNCQRHDIPVLVAARLLRPLGNPPANGAKFFCATEILELALDRNWLVKMTNAVYAYWRTKNQNRRSPAGTRSSVPTTGRRFLHGRASSFSDGACDTSAPYPHASSRA